MKTFRINKDFDVVCDSKRTRNGFKHEATLLKNGRDIEFAKCCYINRTWESYEYQTVIQDLLDKTNELTDRQKKNFLKNAQAKVKQEIDRQFGTIASIAKLGEVFGKDKKEKNDWKTRMIKAGLEGKGLIMPDDWDTLSEDDKEARLNGVIGQLAGTA